MKRIWKQAGDQTGSEIVEFGLVILPLLAVMFVIIDTAWVFFAQASLQHAVQVGVRYAITSNVMKGPLGLPLGLDASIKSVVQQNAMGFLAGDDGLRKISVNFYSPANPSKPVTGIGSDVGGNFVEVSVQGVQVNALGPIWSGPASIFLGARATDVMESSPIGGPPLR